MAEETEAKWYAVQTATGWESKVKTSLEQKIINQNLQDKIFEVVIPMEECVVEKNGQPVTQMRKMLPSYILIKMIHDNQTWYVVRNTDGAGSFVGPEGKPTPLSAEEIKRLGLSRTSYMFTVDVGDSAQVKSGGYAGSIGTVESIDQAAGTVTVLLDSFGRKIPVTLGFSEVEPVD